MLRNQLNLKPYTVLDTSTALHMKLNYLNQPTAGEKISQSPILKEMWRVICSAVELYEQIYKKPANDEISNFITNGILSAIKASKSTDEAFLNILINVENEYIRRCDLNKYNDAKKINLADANTFKEIVGAIKSKFENEDTHHFARLLGLFLSEMYYLKRKYGINIAEKDNHQRSLVKKALCEMNVPISYYDNFNYAHQEVKDQKGINSESPNGSVLNFKQAFPSLFSQKIDVMMNHIDNLIIAYEKKSNDKEKLLRLRKTVFDHLMALAMEKDKVDLAPIELFAKMTCRALNNEYIKVMGGGRSLIIFFATTEHELNQSQDKRHFPRLLALTMQELIRTYDPHARHHFLQVLDCKTFMQVKNYPAEEEKLGNKNSNKNGK